MLKLKYMFENYELAKLALENWEHDEEGLTEYLKYFRISSNAVYPFSIHGKRCFLRLAPVEEKHESNIQGELEFLEYLKEKGYTSMIPISAKTGKLLVRLETIWGEYYASVFEGVAGKAIEDTDYNAAIMHAYGKSLGKLHRLSMEYKPVCRKWSYADALAWIKGMLKEYAAPKHMLLEAEAVEGELGKLEINSENYGLVHYDFEPDNVFYDEEKGSCNVIDFEDGMYHFYLVDIEQVFDALADELSGKALETAKRYFLEGYKSEKKLDLNYEKKLPLMRSFCNLYSYARIIRCVADEIPDAPEWMRNLKCRLQMKISHLESVVGQECLR